MGICLKNKEYNMDMGYIAFGMLRQTIANLYDTQLGNLYKKLYESYSVNSREVAINNINIYLESTDLDNDIIDFLFMSDCHGKISYKVCKKLYQIIKYYDNNIKYGYDWANNSFSYFKKMLNDCALKRRTLYWR